MLLSDDERDRQRCTEYCRLLSMKYDIEALYHISLAAVVTE